MALTHSEPGELGSIAPDFSLPGVCGKTHALSDYSTGPHAAKALVVVFMCNHCPYVQAVDDRINDLAKLYHDKGAALVAINSNDAARYPDDSFAQMKLRAQEKSYAFPYLFDETQEVARAYGAVCTPDFYVYQNVSGQFQLRYRGRLDDNWKEPLRVTQRDLAKALDCILAGKAVPVAQPASMGCSIKWK
ncbi:thioredoxin family protein [Bdellovibrionota bacterium FG-2]